MFKFTLLILLLIHFSNQVVAVKITWDDPESGAGLHIFAEVQDSKSQSYTIREIHIDDTEFYENLFCEPEVYQSIGEGSSLSSAKLREDVESWVSDFANGKPTARMTIEKDGAPVGCIQLAHSREKPGVGELARALSKDVQGGGLGKAVLGFLVNDYAPAIRRIALNQDPEAPASAANKFMCFGGEELKAIYVTSKPSNPASWQCYKHFGFSPSQPIDNGYLISYAGWEKTPHESLEDYIVTRYFSPTSSEELQKDVLYKTTDEKGESRTISFVSKYNSLRYHFERKLN